MFIGYVEIEKMINAIPPHNLLGGLKNSWNKRSPVKIWLQVHENPLHSGIPIMKQMASSIETTK